MRFKLLLAAYIYHLIHLSVNGDALHQVAVDFLAMLKKVICSSSNIFERNAMG